MEDKVYEITQKVISKLRNGQNFALPTYNRKPSNQSNLTKNRVNPSMSSEELIDEITKLVMIKLQSNTHLSIPFQIKTHNNPEECNPERNDCSACGRCPELNPEGVKNIINAGAVRIGNSVGTPSASKISRMIDHTLLKADATQEEIRKLCEEALQFSFAAVCVNPSNVALAVECLKGSQVKVATVVGFPLGASTSTTKALEARDAIANGAHEIDMVINVGALKSRDDQTVLRDIQSVVDVARGKAIVKVILETALLTKDEIKRGSMLSKQAGADYVKTSTGFSTAGAKVEDIILMRSIVGPYMGIKASGGIRDYDKAQSMVKAGATRIGASASVAIAKEDPMKIVV